MEKNKISVRVVESIDIRILGSVRLNYLISNSRFGSAELISFKVLRSSVELIVFGIAYWNVLL